MEGAGAMHRRPLVILSDAVLAWKLRFCRRRRALVCQPARSCHRSFLDAEARHRRHGPWPEHPRSDAADGGLEDFVNLFQSGGDNTADFSDQGKSAEAVRFRSPAKHERALDAPIKCMECDSFFPRRGARHDEPVPSTTGITDCDLPSWSPGNNPRNQNKARQSAPILL